MSQTDILTIARDWECGLLNEDPECSRDIGRMADEIERLREYGEKMRLTCQQLSRRIEELDPTAPKAETNA